MKAKIHYEEDLFYLSLQMKGLREGLRLTVDADYFQDKFLADLRFVDTTLDKVLATLKENPNLIRRAEYLYNLVKVEGAYLELLSDVLEGTGDLREALAPYRNEFLRQRESHDADVHEIRTLLRLVSQEDEREDVITADELSLLTRLDDESETTR
jgi:disulfide oxidoreductase YuzD